ncbi:RIP metalloprotease RseP [Fundidesulfovibrio butyratiphilus]
MTALTLKAVSVVVVLGVLIFIHELGHFLFARLFGMGVRTFSLGFGPKMFGVMRGQTEYRLSAIPLGGYVQLVGQDAEDDTTEGFPRQAWFILRPAWQRMLVVAAGPLFNLVLALVIYSSLFWVNGRYEVPAAVGQVTEGGAAQKAGLQPGDAIRAVDGQPIAYFGDLKRRVDQSGGRPLVLTIARKSETFDVSVTPDIVKRKNLFGEDIAQPLLGVASPAETINIPLGPGQALTEGARQTWEVTSLIGQVFVKLVQGVVPVSNLGGPIMIAEMVGKQSEQGFTALALLTAMISVNLAILNLLPIPVLDGGHILFFGLEIILRRPVSDRIKGLTTKVGFALLMGLLLLATANDLTRLIVGKTG